MTGRQSDQSADPHSAAGLELRRQVVRGFAAGGLTAAAIFGFFALVPGTTRPLGLYVGLAVVLGVTSGLLGTIVLVGWRSYRLADLD